MKVVLMIYVIIALIYFLLNVSCFCIRSISDLAKYAGKQTGMEMFKEDASKHGNFKTGIKTIILSFIGGIFWPITIYLTWKFWDRL